MKYITTLLLFVMLCSNISAQEKSLPEKGNVIFIHPDGTSVAVWNAVRMLNAGPDSNINWDRLPSIGIYLGHLTNSLTATSNGGGTVHAYGVKVGVSAYGMDNHEIPTSRSGKKMSIVQEAMKAGIKTGLINSGSIIEPGTGAFVVSVNARAEDAEIARQTIFSGVDVIICTAAKNGFCPKAQKVFIAAKVKEPTGLT